MRSTTLSPWSVGRVETRRSISRPIRRSLIRPSCGSRRSAMFSFAMILMRDTIAAWRRRLDVVENAVDPVADLQLVLERLDVDVRGALLDRPADEQVHEADDRRLR